MAYARNNDNPANAMPVWIVGDKTYNTAANTTGHAVATGAGVFKGLSINTAGVTSSATIYDGTNTSGTKLGTYSTTSQGFVPANFAFTDGLFVVLAGGTPADITIAYR